MYIEIYRTLSSEEGAHILAHVEPPFHLHLDTRAQEGEAYWKKVLSEARARYITQREDPEDQDHGFILFLEKEGWEIMPSAEYEFNIVDL